MGQQALGPIPNAKARKLINTIEALAASNEILAHENTYLHIQFDKQKKKYQKNMNLAQQLRSEEGTGALIFSPTKIARAKEIVAEKEEKKTQKKKELKDRKVEIALDCYKPRVNTYQRYLVM